MSKLIWLSCISVDRSVSFPGPSRIGPHSDWLEIPALEHLYPLRSEGNPAKSGYLLPRWLVSNYLTSISELKPVLKKIATYLASFQLFRRQCDLEIMFKTLKFSAWVWALTLEFRTLLCVQSRLGGVFFPSQFYRKKVKISLHPSPFRYGCHMVKWTEVDRLLRERLHVAARSANLWICITT